MDMHWEENCLCNSEINNTQSRCAGKKVKFLNNITESPWKNCAPYSFPYVKRSEKHIYNSLDYNQWKYFTKDFVINKLFKKSNIEGDATNKRWRELYGRLCVDPIGQINEEDFKFIGEYVRELPPSLFRNLNENVQICSFAQDPSPSIREKIGRIINLKRTSVRDINSLGRMLNRTYKPAASALKEEASSKSHVSNSSKRDIEETKPDQKQEGTFAVNEKVNKTNEDTVNLISETSNSVKLIKPYGFYPSFETPQVSEFAIEDNPTTLTLNTVSDGPTLTSSFSCKKTSNFEVNDSGDIVILSD